MNGMFYKTSANPFYQVIMLADLIKTLFNLLLFYRRWLNDFLVFFQGNRQLDISQYESIYKAWLFSICFKHSPFVKHFISNLPGSFFSTIKGCVSNINFSWQSNMNSKYYFIRTLWFFSK